LRAPPRPITDRRLISTEVPLSRTTSQVVGILAIIAVALCLVPAGAHLFELPNKMALGPAQYMTVQTIYAGWALFGIAVFSALALTAWHALTARGHRAAFLLSLAAFALIAATQAIFWTYTFPMNALTQNWTVPPPDLEWARRQWEYSHAVNALLTFAAFVAITLSVVMASADRRD
jgi:hypothetical protein